MVGLLCRDCTKQTFFRSFPLEGKCRNTSTKWTASSSFILAPNTVEPGSENGALGLGGTVARGVPDSFGNQYPCYLLSNPRVEDPTTPSCL